MYRFNPTAPSPSASFICSNSSIKLWHQRLGHLASPTLLHALKSNHISFSSSLDKCLDCLSNKSHKLPFSRSFISSSYPLEIVYFDVWGPAPINSIDDFHYYVIFLDHFSKYVWLYPLKLKSDVSIIFPIFKNLVEIQLNSQIKTLYSDNGGEFIKLRPFLQNHGISHMKTPPYTPEHNGVSERKHHHLIEMARCLLHHASLPPIFWTFAFQTTAYLINHLPTLGLNMTTPHHILFKTPPNYNKLKIFGCLYFPGLKPYTNNKLEPRSEPCLFLGYSLTKSAYICFNFKNNKFYHSRNLQFVETVYPYSSKSNISSINSN